MVRTNGRAKYALYILKTRRKGNTTKRQEKQQKNSSNRNRNKKSPESAKESAYILAKYTFAIVSDVTININNKPGPFEMTKTCAQKINNIV